jgi:hypothetical protein
MEQELVNIIASKSFKQLTERELEALADWCTTKEEFDQLKLVFQGAERLRVKTAIEPSTERKASLDELFASAHTKNKRFGIFQALYPEHKSFMLRPLVQVAAVGLIALIAIPFFRDNQQFNTSHVANVTEKNKVVNKQDSVVKTEPVMVAKSETALENNRLGSSESMVLEELPFSTAEASSYTTSGVSVPEAITAEYKDAEIMLMSVAPASVSKMANDERLETSDHPDGIYQGRKKVQYAVPVSSQGNVLELITASF